MSTKFSYAVTAMAAAAVLTGCHKSNKDQADLTAQAKTAAEASGYRPPDDGSTEVLHVYTWSDYISPDVIAQFEKSFDNKVEVKIDTFDSNETMYAKLKAGGTGYDIIMPSSYQVAMMAREGLIEKIDHAKCPNVKKNFDPRFAGQVYDPDFTYNVPYIVTYTGFMYDKNKTQGVDMESWAVLGNPAFKGRVTLLDDIREVIGAGLMYNGFSINATNPAEIDRAVEQVLAWRRSGTVRKFDAESYKTEVADGSSWIGHGYSSDTTQVILGDEDNGVPARENIGFALPKEGYSIAFDEMVIARGSEHKDLAYAFINFLYDGEVACENMEYVQGPMPVKPGIEALDEELRSIIVLDDEQLKRGQVLKELDPVAFELYNKAWDKIKASDK